MFIIYNLKFINDLTLKCPSPPKVSWRALCWDWSGTTSQCLLAGRNCFLLRVFLFVYLYYNIIDIYWLCWVNDSLIWVNYEWLRLTTKPWLYPIDLGLYNFPEMRFVWNMSTKTTFTSNSWFLHKYFWLLQSCYLFLSKPKIKKRIQLKSASFTVLGFWVAWPWLSWISNKTKRD